MDKDSNLHDGVNHYDRDTSVLAIIIFWTGYIIYWIYSRITALL